MISTLNLPVQTPRPKPLSRVPRPEELTVARIHEALHHSGYDQLRRIQVYYHHGRVVLQGRVSTYYMKQVAQEAVRTIPEVVEIDNDLSVVCSR